MIFGHAWWNACRKSSELAFCLPNPALALMSELHCQDEGRAMPLGGFLGRGKVPDLVGGLALGLALGFQGCRGTHGSPGGLPWVQVCILKNCFLFGFQ